MKPYIKNYVSRRLKRIANMLAGQTGIPKSSRTPVELLLKAVLKKKNADFTIVQVGASDGERNDYLREALCQYQIKAVLLEPLPQAFAKLKLLYPETEISNIKLCNAALSETDGVAKFYTPSNSAPYVADQLSSFSREHLIKNGVKPHHIEEIEVQTISFPTLLKKYDINHINLLQIDTEGYDHHIIGMFFDLSGINLPDIINFEHNHIPPDTALPFYDRLKQKGYTWTNSEWDTCAVRDSFWSLL